MWILVWGRRQSSESGFTGFSGGSGSKSGYIFYLRLKDWERLFWKPDLSCSCTVSRLRGTVSGTRLLGWDG